MKVFYNHILVSLVGVLTLLLVSLLWREEVLLFVLLILNAILMLYLVGFRKNLVIFLFCAVFGAIAEIIAIYFGAWHYSNPQILGIPIWLPVLWGIASLFMNNLSKVVSKYF